MKFKLLAGPSVGNVFVLRNWYGTDTGTERQTEKQRDGGREGGTERRSHKLMTFCLLEYLQKDKIQFVPKTEL